MLFNSFNFLVFFPIVTAVYFMLPLRLRWLWILAASCYFYMAFVPVFILILMFTITVDYFAGMWIEKSEGARRRHFLLASIFANVGVLFVFKYFNFFDQNLAALAHFLDWNYSLKTLSLVLPIGLSFHTFQSLSYTIEIYLRRQKAERNYLTLALYVLFYPQLVAGPIERPQNLLHQFYQKHEFNWTRIGSGLELMLLGFFKKLFIADNLAQFVDPVFRHPEGFIAPSYWIAMIFFIFQLYCDFSGYTDIARGAARVMGVHLMQNFTHPFFSRSMAEFWRHWHISLSTWFRDYFFTPLSLARERATRQWMYVSILLTYLVVGLWHGAGWTFVTMGAIQGGTIVIGTATKTFRDRVASVTRFASLPRVRAAFQMLFTFLVMAFSLIFFRATSMANAFSVAGGLFSGWGSAVTKLSSPEALTQYIFMEHSHPDMYWPLAGMLALLVGEYLLYRGYLERILKTENEWARYSLRWFLVSTALLMIIVFARTDSQQFIYFQF